ncbi:hypothetical protein [Spirosoma rhododendri]|uniref:Lipoprotein n=1 Tax=Spirosoma rhododendri TaxID=2728024 RepID=A0A7L5DV57_9BACT|nr:hypothetical protein [Spirosoma rhododendri]QJD79440.1 hypothetical protein HH216_14250 [Spirosoma rhododendri]
MNRTLLTFRSLCLLLMLTAGLSCSRENLLTLPAPAPAIAGTYVNRHSYSTLPVQGDSVTVTLVSVANDTVDVTMQATSQGKPGTILRYGKRAVVQDFSVGSCVSYVVPLNPGRDSTILYMTCSDYNVLRYDTKQRPYFTGLTDRFFKR